MLFHKQGVDSKFARRWEKGLWLGKSPTTDEHLLGAALGRQFARAVARTPERHRWGKRLFNAVVCTPWEPKRSLMPQTVTPRITYLTRAIVDRRGETVGCPACAGGSGNHTAACRARLVEALSEEHRRAEAEGK